MIKCLVRLLVKSSFYTHKNALPKIVIVIWWQSANEPLLKRVKFSHESLSVILTLITTEKKLLKLVFFDQKTI
jgi:hypothetical protein